MANKNNPDFGGSNSCNISLYDYHINVIRKYKKKAGFKKDAQAIQSIIEYFAKNKDKSLIKNLLVFIIYPLVIWLTLNRIANTLFELNNEMLAAGIKFEALYRFANVVNLFGLAVSAFGATSIILFILIIRKRGF